MLCSVCNRQSLQGQTSFSQKYVGVGKLWMHHFHLNLQCHLMVFVAAAHAVRVVLSLVQSVLSVVGVSFFSCMCKAEVPLATPDGCDDTCHNGNLLLCYVSHSPCISTGPDKIQKYRKCTLIVCQAIYTISDLPTTTCRLGQISTTLYSNEWQNWFH